MPRALWTLTIDKDKSENVVFDGDLVQFIEPGRNVYIPVKAIDGYEISEIIFSKNSYISGDPVYYSENGYYKIDAISGTVTAYVVAVKSDNDAGDNSDDSDDDKTVNEKDKDQIDPDQKDNKRIDQENQDKENPDKENPDKEYQDKENPDPENSVEYNSDKENTNTDTVDKNTDSTASVTSTDINTDINTEINTDTKADINTEANTDTNTETSTDTNIDTNTETSTETNTDTNNDTNNDTEVNNIEAEDNAVNSEINRVTNPQEWLAADNNAVADNVVPEAVQNDEPSAENDTEVKVSDNTVTTETIENTESALAGDISGSNTTDLSAEEPVKSGISAAKIILISTALSLLAAAIIAVSIIYLKRKKEKEL